LTAAREGAKKRCLLGLLEGVGAAHPKRKCLSPKLLCGGGFMAVFVRGEDHAKIRQALKGLLYVPLKFESGGGQIML